MNTLNYKHPMSAFDSFFGGDPFEAFAPLFELSRKRTSSVEWFEDDSNYYARVDLPGVAKEDLDIEYEADLVTLLFTSSRKDENGEKVRFERTMRVPDGIEADGINAGLVDGVLTLTLPKAPEKKPVNIKIS